MFLKDKKISPTSSASQTDNPFYYLTSKAFFVLSCLVSISILFLVFYYAQFGFDITDESFYLAHISKPQDYKAWPSSFGAVFHPLFMLVNQDLILLRWLTLGLIYILAFILILLLSRKTNAFPESIENKLIQIFIHASFAYSVYKLAIFTPSYNLLTFASLILATIASLTMLSNSLITKAWGALLLGFSGMLVFLAKPSSAAFLAILMLIYLLMAQRRYFMLIVLIGGASAFSFLFVFALTQPGGVLGFIQGTQGGLKYMELMDGGYDNSQIVLSCLKLVAHAPWLALNLDPIFLSASLVFTIIILFGLKKNWLLGVFLIPPLIWSMMAIKTSSIYPKQFLLVVYLCSSFLMLSVIGRLLYQKKLDLRKSDLLQSKRDFHILFLLFLLPLCATFGTNNNYAIHAQQTAFFYGLSSLLAISILFPNAKLAINFAGLFNAVSLLLVFWQAIHTPYRQYDFTSNYYEQVEVLKGKTPIYVDKITAAYTRNLQDISNTLPSPAPLLFDLTGQTPYAAQTLQASSFGLAWTLGGYKGSEQALTYVYDQIPCDRIAGAWILIEEAGMRSISPKTLERYGIYLKDYQQVQASLFIPGTSRGRAFTEIYEQNLYKPIISYTQSLKQCIDKRSQH